MPHLAFASEHFKEDFALGFAVLESSIDQVNASTNQVFQFCAQGFSAFLSGLEGSHEARGILRVDRPRFGKQLAILAVESVKSFTFSFPFNAE